MTTPFRGPNIRRFYVGLIALGIVVVCGIGLGQGPLIHHQHGGEIFLFVILPLLFVAVWGVTTGRHQTPETKEEAEASRAKGLENRLELGCAVFLITPIASAAVGYVGAYAFEVHPMDRASVVAAYAGIGFIAGCFITVAIFLSSIFE